jgi:hypothetical protein
MSRRNGYKLELGIERITPLMATEMLLANTINRTIRPRRVSQYARDMKAGNWVPVGEPIAISDKGDLLNGQHRLHAVIEADVTVDIPVARGVPAHLQDSMDRGLKRTFSDVLKLHYDEVNVTMLAAAVKQVHQYRATGILGRTGGHHPATSATTAELIKTYEAEPNLGRSHGMVTRVRHEQWFAPGLLMALHYIFSEVDPDEADAFFQAFATGEDQKRGSAILALRKLGTRRPMDFSSQAQAAIIIKAFNYWRAGRTINTGNLRWRAGGSSPEQFPKILTPDEIANGQTEVGIEELEEAVA